MADKTNFFAEGGAFHECGVTEQSFDDFQEIIRLSAERTAKNVGPKTMACLEGFGKESKDIAYVAIIVLGVELHNICGDAKNSGIPEAEYEKVLNHAAATMAYMHHKVEELTDVNYTQDEIMLDVNTMHSALVADIEAKNA